MAISLSLGEPKSNITLSKEDKSSISLSLPAKSNITLSKESKDTSLIWNDVDWTWDSATSQWDAPKLTLSKGETKSNITLSKESK